MASSRRIGPYEVVRVLDAGGMGKVYLAKEAEGPTAGRLLVVKTMRAEYERTPEHVESFHREARLLAHLRHPNIVQLFDAGRVGHRLYMAMEYLEGLDLAKVLKLLAAHGKKIPLSVVAHIATEVALALDAAHAYESEPGKRAGLVHRDLSPHNIFLLWGGGVKLLDFGLARAFGEVGTTRTGMVKGKFRYLAPEQARGESLDHRVDIFTLGLVLHEMLTGRRAYEQPGDVDVLRSAMAGEFPRLHDVGVDVPASFVRVVERACEADREARYPTAIALAEDLREASMEVSLAVDPLTLRSFMSEVRALAIADPPPMHVDIDDEEDDFASGDARPSRSYFRSSPPIERPLLPSAQRGLLSSSRAWLAAAGLAAVVLLLVLVSVTRRSPSTVASPTSAVYSAPVQPSVAPPVPPPSATASDSAFAPPDAPPPKAGSVAAPIVGAPAASPKGPHRVIRPKRGVGTGVIADYP